MHTLRPRLSWCFVIATAAALLTAAALAISSSAKPHSIKLAPMPRHTRVLRPGSVLYAPRIKHVRRYIWERCNTHGRRCLVIRNAHGRRYRITRRDVGHRIILKMIVVSGTGSTTVVTPPTPTVSGPAPVNTALPTISGIAQQGDTLTGALGTWTGAVSFSYLWEDCDTSGANCVAAQGPNAAGTTTDSAAAPLYVLQASDVGFTIRLQVTAFAAGAAGAASARSAVR